MAASLVKVLTKDDGHEVLIESGFNLVFMVGYLFQTSELLVLYKVYIRYIVLYKVASTVAKV